MKKTAAEIGNERSTELSTRQDAEMRAELYRRLPSVNDLVLASELQPLIEVHGRERVVRAIRELMSEVRRSIAAAEGTATADLNAEAVAESIGALLRAAGRYSLRRVINATGVLLHTNLGRAPLSEEAVRHVTEVAQGYSNLELDLETGERSRRDIHIELLVLRNLQIADEEADRWDVLVANNCAGATFLALNALAENREVVVSRGELVEIGGGFRIPEILEKSGAVLREVGTTNRTRVGDYEGATTEQTALILRVHQSNFSIEGFTERPSLEDLVTLSRTIGVPLFEDQGTGLIKGMEQFGIHGQPTLVNSIAAGVDLVATSGDKLLGGPQCGLLIGRKDLIARIRKNPLMRAFRVDKLTYAALEATLLQYVSGGENAIPLMQMLSTPASEIGRRCNVIAGSMASTVLHATVVPVRSVVGGGTAPNATLPSFALSLQHATLTAAELLSALRKLDTPIIGRIANDAVLLDLRTVFPESDGLLRALLQQL